jgi:opacity protein-like surface antigen
MKRILLILLAFTAFNSFSQESEAPVATPKIAYYGRFTAGVLTGDRSAMSFQFANGVRLGHFDVGMGLGFERFYTSGYAPLFLESRYNFGNGATNPFVGVTAGYLASLDQYMSKRGGYTFGLNVGMTHHFTKHFGVTTSIGYRFAQTQERDYYYIMWGGEYTTIRDMHRVEVRVGIALR